MEAAKWRIADDILFGKGNVIDWNSRFVFFAFFFVSFALLIGCDPLVWLDMKKRGSRLWTICRS